MRVSVLDSTESDFVQVMGLITRMFKQTAIAKVILRLLVVIDIYFKLCFSSYDSNNTFISTELFQCLSVFPENSNCLIQKQLFYHYIIPNFSE